MPQQAVASGIPGRAGTVRVAELYGRTGGQSEIGATPLQVVCTGTRLDQVHGLHVCQLYKGRSTNEATRRRPRRVPLERSVTIR